MGRSLGTLFILLCCAIVETLIVLIEIGASFYSSPKCSEPEEMYRRDVGGEQCHFKERLVFIIFPNYFYEYENVLMHIRKTGFGIVRKVARVIRDREAADWVGEFSRFSEFIADGPSMLLLIERGNPFLSIHVVIEEHNNTSMRMNGYIGVYASPNTVRAQRDIRFFFNDLYDEKKFYDNMTTYLNELVWQKLRPALAELSLRRPSDPIKWLALFLQGKEEPDATAVTSQSIAVRISNEADGSTECE